VSFLAKEICAMPVNKTVGFSLGSLLLMIALSACTVESPPVKGFVLPDGDVAMGEKVFVKYGCHGCHTIAGVELPKIEPEPPLIVEIGGEVYRVKNYGELLTSVINPNHEISQENINTLADASRTDGNTPMPYYGDSMTITEMVNLVAFLRAQYSKVMPDFFESYYPEDMKKEEKDNS
jgi:mono/diheme cytochrome c family protein